jgi:NAD(P)-dependent dehydrogenase (short-subunit alcohol dehydrogenase family)
MTGGGPITTADLAAAARALRALLARPELCQADADAAVVLALAAQLTRAAKAAQKREARRRDRDLLDATLSRSGPDDLPAPPLLLSTPRRCYVCKRPYERVHAFYHSLCPECGDENLRRRTQTADLTGRVALVTGARVRIGYQVALKLLRAGAAVVAVTRFPCDAARRFGQEADFAAWADRLHVHALDLRHLPEVVAFTDRLKATCDRLDVLVNNAAQTVRRPPAFYRHLVEAERAGPAALPAPLARLVPSTGLISTADPLPPALRTQLPLLPGDDSDAAFPPGEYDADGQQIDRRDRNSWVLDLADVPPVELLEVHFVNCLAPFLLLRQLEPLLLRSPAPHRFVVNVASLEGQFAGGKTGRHPHTNMAKAALNMLTRTCADAYAARGVFVNSVDTGLVSYQGPATTVERLEEEGLPPPLDAVDAAARVLAPVFDGVSTGQPQHGRLWKDYAPTSW